MGLTPCNTGATQIAQKLDALEREQMAVGGLESKEYLTFLAADSSNYDDSGFFSSQVRPRARVRVRVRMRRLRRTRHRRRRRRRCI